MTPRSAGVDKPLAAEGPGDPQGTGTIVNDDAVPAMTIHRRRAGRRPTSFAFTVTISQTANATVSFATADRSAQAGSDYLASSGTVTFTAGGAVTHMIVVPATGDTIQEFNETFLVNLSGAAGATIADAQGVGTILGDDGPPPGPTEIPTLGQWPLILLMLVLAALGASVARRRR